MTTRHGMRLAAIALAGALTLGAAGAARAEWMQPDPTYREAQQALKDAARDTVGHGDDAARLATLGAAQLRMCKPAEDLRDAACHGRLSTAPVRHRDGDLSG